MIPEPIQLDIFDEETDRVLLQPGPANENPAPETHSRSPTEDDQSESRRISQIVKERADRLREMSRRLSSKIKELPGITENETK